MRGKRKTPAAPSVKCPSWCDWKLCHDDPDDILHMGKERAVELEHAPRVAMTEYTSNKGARHYTVPGTVNVYLIQPHAEERPEMHLGFGEKLGVRMTLVEAHQLERALHLLIEVGEVAK